MEKFQDLKMGTNLFNNFYSEFIHLALDIEYMFVMLIQKFKHKLIPRFQNWLNFGVELPTFFSVLVKQCLSIYK